MLRRALRGVAVLLTAASAAAAQPLRPAEEPPADFAGRQYIDSTGCVFLRDGKLWSPRLGRDGAPVCGYPPTPVGAAGAVAPRAALAPVPLDGMGRIEAELLTAVTASMAPGDWAGRTQGADGRGADRAAPSATDAEPGDLGQVMAAAVAASPAIARAAAASVPGSALNPSPRLCTLLGMEPGSAERPLRPDPTGGYCSGLVAPALAPRAARREAAAGSARSAAAEGGAASPRRGAGAAPPRAGSGGQPRRPAAAAEARAPSAAAPVPPGRLIPAGTRFLQIGSFADAAAADAALRRIAALGLPVARSRDAGAAGGRVVMAGPFATREAVVRAHDRLTRAGFGGLVPRQ